MLILYFSFFAEELKDVVDGSANNSIYDQHSVSQHTNNNDRQDVGEPAQVPFAADPREEYSFPGDVEWSSQAIHNAPDRPIFEEDSRITAPLDSQSSPLDCFLLFFDLDIINKIKSETNRYANLLPPIIGGLANKSGQEIPATPSGQISSTADRLTGRHFPQKIPATDKKARPYRSCKVCIDRHKKELGNWARKETTFYCPSCDVGLCVPDCFYVFHTRADYT